MVECCFDLIVRSVYIAGLARTHMSFRAVRDFMWRVLLSHALSTWSAGAVARISQQKHVRNLLDHFFCSFDFFSSFVLLFPVFTYNYMSIFVVVDWFIFFAHGS